MSVLVTTDSMVMASSAVTLTNALLITIHATKMLIVPTLSVLISVLVLMGTMVMDISAMTSMNASQTLTTVMNVLEFAKTMMVLSHVCVRLEPPVTASTVLKLMNVLVVLIRAT